MNKQVTSHSSDDYQQLVCDIVQQALNKGASQAEVSASCNRGLDLNVRLGDIETLEYINDKGIGITVYYGQCKGLASLTDMTAEAISEAVDKACAIAKYTQADDCAGLAESQLMAHQCPELDLYYPWAIDVDEASRLAIECEKIALDQDQRITNSEGVNLHTSDSLFVYGNSHGFVGAYPRSRASISCSLIASQAGHMQRDYNYTVATDPADLMSLDDLAKGAAEATVSRLGARKIKTCEAPVIFSSRLAAGLLRHFVAAISGSNLYRKSSFLLEHLHQAVLPQHVNIEEDPFLAKGLASSPFDMEGVKVSPRSLVKDGVLEGYVLGSYAARKLGMTSTGNAGGIHNLLVSHTGQTDQELCKAMGTGLVVTELMGQGVNLVTGNYSRGASGYWVEQGEIQFPVEEITIAGNLKDMLQQIVAISSEIDTRSAIRTGAILIEKMSIAGA